jgi:hypothetical protein
MERDNRTGLAERKRNQGKACGLQRNAFPDIAIVCHCLCNGYERERERGIGFIVT